MTIKTITVYCVNGEVYVPTKRQARDEVTNSGDTISKVRIEYDSIRQLICDCLIHEPVISEEEEQ